MLKCDTGHTWTDRREVGNSSLDLLPRGLRCGSTFILSYVLLKTAILLHTEGLVKTEMASTVHRTTLLVHTVDTIEFGVHLLLNTEQKVLRFSIFKYYIV